MTQQENDELERLVLVHIKNGTKTLSPIAACLIKGPSPVQGKKMNIAYRVADRTLQRLRKKGLVKFDPKTGWAAIETEYTF